MFLRKKLIFLGKKQSTSVLVQTQKTMFFQEKMSKNAENDYFNQHLECAVPKRWSKYTTSVGPSDKSRVPNFGSDETRSEVCAHTA